MQPPAFPGGSAVWGSPPGPFGVCVSGAALISAPFQVKAFVTEDIPLYHNLVMKHLPGADPELVLLSFRYEELERIPLSDMSREEINQLVQELGFYRKEAPDAPVPEEFQLAPARPLPTLQTKEQGPGTPSPPAPAAKSKPPRKPDNQEHPDL
ncbi:unnamed protein product [Caretta caretta]